MSGGRRVVGGRPLRALRQRNVVLSYRVVSVTVCPMCDSELVGEVAQVRWCERCDWNVDPLHHASGPLGTDEQASVARARKLYEVALAQGPEGLPRLGASLALFALVLPLLAFHLVALGTGVAVFTGTSSLVWRFVVGGPLVLLGLLPVLHRTAHAGRVVRLVPDEHEALFVAVANIAEALGSRPPRRVEVSDRWLIAVLADSAGTLEIGLPLWASLRPQERRAVLAQQVYSLRRARNMRRGFDVACLRMVALWTTTSRLDYANRRAPGLSQQTRAEWRTAAPAGSAAPQVTQRKMLLRWPLEVWSRLVARATEHESWCVVYRADSAATALVSAEAVAGAISVVHSAKPRYEARESEWRRQANADSWWPRIRELATDVPASERLRWMRSAELAQDQEPFGPFPPHGWRLAVVSSHGATSAQPTTFPTTSIDDALAAPARRVASMMIDGSTDRPRHR